MLTHNATLDVAPGARMTQVALMGMALRRQDVFEGGGETAQAPARLLGGDAGGHGEGFSFLTRICSS